MARSHVSFLLLSLLLAAAALPSRAIIIGDTLATVSVAGRLFCTVDGNAVAGILSPPLVGADVLITCNGGQITLGQVITDLAGTFTVIYSTVDGLLFDSSTCSVTVTVANVVGCTILPPTRILGGTIQLVRIVEGPLSPLTSLLFNVSSLVITS